MADKKLPTDIPTPNKQSVAPATELSKDSVEKLLSGETSFQQLFGLSNEVLLTFANQGYLFYNQGKYPEAETIFKGLAALNPKDPYYHTALGSIRVAQEKYDEALECFEKAIEYDGDFICALVNRGEIRLRKGLVLEAAADFGKAVKLDEQNVKRQMDNKEKPTPDPAAQRARILSKVTFEVLKEIESKVKEAQERGELTE